MKTKNVKVKLKHIKQGVTIYIACPAYGIKEYRIIGRPYELASTGSLFVEVEWLYKGDVYKKEISLCDAGITSTYNDKRSFFKIKHAKEWQNKWKDDPGFKLRHAKHEEMVSDMIEMDIHYGY